jgi:hypothetical protein
MVPTFGNGVELRDCRDVQSARRARIQGRSLRREPQSFSDVFAGHAREMPARIAHS